jgi:protein-disulfide isomerase
MAARRPTPPKKKVQSPKYRGTKSGGLTAQRRTLLIVFGGVLVAAAAIAAALVLVSRGGGSDSSTATNTTTVRSTQLAGIPQHGVTLGKPSAPGLIEYADLQCPYCGEFARNVLPTVVREYVRPGKLKLVFRGLAFIGPDSTKALQAVYSASEQNRAWDVLEALYEAQGTENTGWVTDDLLHQIGAGIQGLDVDRWLAQTDSPTVRKEFAAANEGASKHGVRSTPTFFLGDREVRLTALTPAAFRQAIDPLLAG